MSEQPTGPARRENIFTHKIGPLPMWGWVAIVAAMLVAWRLYSSKSSASATASPTTTPSTPADQVPQFVNQTYVTGTAPAATSPDTTTPAPVPTNTPAPSPSGWTPISWWGSPGAAPVPASTVPAPNTAPAATPVKVQQFPPPTGLRTTSVANNSVGLRWTTVPSGTQYPGSYTVAIYNSKGKLASETTVTTPDATGGGGVTTVTGLQPKTAYHANVWANGGAIAPHGATVNFTTT